MNCYKLLVLVIAALAAGCGYPDRRDADVIVDDQALVRPAIFALAWWQEATSDLPNAKLEGHCGQEHCIYLKFSDALPDRTLGRTYNFRSSTPLDQHSASYVFFNSNRDDLTMVNWSFVVAHELGHAFGLEHASDADDIMYPTWPDESCIGEQSLVMWRDEYGDNGRLRVTCKAESDAPGYVPPEAEPQ